MVCSKCGTKLTKGKECASCGHYNSNINVHIPAKNKMVSAQLAVFMFILITYNVVMFVINLVNFFVQEADNMAKISNAVNIVSALAQIVICVFIIKKHRWAFNAFLFIAGAMVLTSLLDFHVGSFMSAFSILIFFFLVFHKDWDEF